jgi:hypothetical protein
MRESSTVLGVVHGRWRIPTLDKLFKALFKPLAIYEMSMLIPWNYRVFILLFLRFLLSAHSMT